MKKEELLKLAKEAGFSLGGAYGEPLDRFAALLLAQAQPQAPVAEQPKYPTFRGTIHRLPPPKPRHETPTHEVLARADGKAELILLLAYDKDGATYFDTNILDGGDVIWLLETCKKKLLEGTHE